MGITLLMEYLTFLRYDVLIMDVAVRGKGRKDKDKIKFISFYNISKNNNN